MRNEATTEHAQAGAAARRLTDARFRELVGVFLIEREEAAGATRAVEAYEENAREAESALTGRSENLDELHARRDQAASVASAAREEARRARVRAGEAASRMGEVVSMLREEGMPPGEWIRHGDLGVFLQPHPEEGPGIATRPWNWVERSPAGANPAEVEKAVPILEDLGLGRRKLRSGLAASVTGVVLFVGAFVVAGPLGEAARYTPWRDVLFFATFGALVVGAALVAVGLKIAVKGEDTALSARRALRQFGRDDAGT